MKIAIEGCAHGELDKIYETISELEKKENWKVDLLICCGDFQSVRNVSDLKCMAVPDKYLEMNSFYKYYSGEKTAPVLTLFIGGNHEASNYLSELAYGGWVAPNIYFLGHAGVVKFGEVRIAGLSGIYKGYDYLKGRHECPPYDKNSKTSVYHIRNIDVFRLKQVPGNIDIAISHDWPRGIHEYGDVEGLLRIKRHFEQDIRENKLGSRPTEDLLLKLQPSYWFSAHLHVKFAAVVPHKTEDGSISKTTKFLSLDKCLPRRKFLQIIDIDRESENKPVLQYDKDWLCILRSTNDLISVQNKTIYMPGPGCSNRYNFEPTDEEKKEVETLLDNNFKIPENFVKTVEAYKSSDELDLRSAPLAVPQLNPQTTLFCQIMGINDPLAQLMEQNGLQTSTEPIDYTFVDESEADITVSIDNHNEISCFSDEDDPSSKEALSKDDDSSSKRISEDGNIEVNKEMMPKKFKRRNQAIYASQEDD